MAALAGRLHMQMRSGPEAATEGRHALDELHGSISREELAELRLLVTELVTNSVRHGSAPKGWITLDVEIYCNAIRVKVADNGPGFVPKPVPTPHPDRPGGWGLLLLHNLADRWGVHNGDPTEVWFEVDRQQALVTA